MTEPATVPTTLEAWTPVRLLNSEELYDSAKPNVENVIWENVANGTGLAGPVVVTAEPKTSDFDSAETNADKTGRSSRKTVKPLHMHTLDKPHIHHAKQSRQKNFGDMVKLEMPNMLLTQTSLVLAQFREQNWDMPMIQILFLLTLGTTLHKRP